MIPLFHELAGARILVFGGGRVGARKARQFADEAQVVVVSPTFVDDRFGSVERVRAAPGPSEVEGWFDRFEPRLVIAATDDATVNRAVERIAHDRGVLSNRADRGRGHVPGDVVMPATYRDDPVIVAILTGGPNPALSRYLRERIGDELAGAGAVSEATTAVRESLREREIDVDTRRAVLRRLVRDERIWSAARSEDPDLDRLVRDIAQSCLSEEGTGAS